MTNKKIGAISQPTYLSWAGYFEQISYVDVFIFLDNVQFPRRNWCNRNRILNNGQTQLLTVPVIKASRDTKICEIKISSKENWVENHLKSIEYSYQKSPHFAEIFALIKKELEKKHEYLADLNIALINSICDYLDIKTKKIRASERQYSSKRTQLLLDTCKNYGIKHYYTSLGSKVYLDKESQILEKEGIQIKYQNYEPIEYKQHKSKDFIPYLSIIDLLFNLSKEEALVVIKAGAKH